MSWTMRLLNGVFFLAFALSVAVQYNDPDPLRWMAIYGAAAVLCLWRPAPPWRWRIPLLVAVVALIWVAMLLPGFFGRISVGEAASSWKMMSPEMEEARETGGLLIVAFWMVIISLVAWCARRREVPTAR